MCKAKDTAAFGTLRHGLQQTLLTMHARAHTHTPLGWRMCSEASSCDIRMPCNKRNQWQAVGGSRPRKREVQERQEIPRSWGTPSLSSRYAIQLFLCRRHLELGKKNHSGVTSCIIMPAYDYLLHATNMVYTYHIRHTSVTVEISHSKFD